MGVQGGRKKGGGAEGRMGGFGKGGWDGWLCKVEGGQVDGGQEVLLDVLYANSEMLLWVNSF